MSKLMVLANKFAKIAQVQRQEAYLSNQDKENLISLFNNVNKLLDDFGAVIGQPTDNVSAPIKELIDQVRNNTITLKQAKQMAMTYKTLLNVYQPTIQSIIASADKILKS